MNKDMPEQGTHTDGDKAPGAGVLTRRHVLLAGMGTALGCSLPIGSQKSSQSEPMVRIVIPPLEVPDTLDLAERGGLAVHGLTGAVDCRNDLFESYHVAHMDQNPPFMTHYWGGPVCQRPVQALPLLRTMSGSTENGDYDRQMAKALTRTVEADGRWWLNVAGHPGRVPTFKVDQSWPTEQGELMVALMDWHRYDGDPYWLDVVGRMSDGLRRIAIHGDDRSWYYTAYSRKGWLEHPDALSSEQGTVGDKTKEPATRPFFDIGRPLQAFSRWYEISGDEKALDQAHRLARYLLKPEMWGWRGVPREIKDEQPSAVSGFLPIVSDHPSQIVDHEHARWEGHFHAHSMGALGLMAYARATNDNRIFRFVGDFYRHGRLFGIPRIGFVPGVIGPLEELRNTNKAFGGKGEQVMECCAVADMIQLAIGLSDAGEGDYWDDVDQYVRNHLVEHQLLRRDILEEIAAASPDRKSNPEIEMTENVIERIIGTFVSGSDPTMSYAWWTMCCPGNGSTALYRAWEGILRHRDGAVEVNLLLNRTSQWMDVESWLPYEGKVVLRNWTAREAAVRLPRWVDKSAVKCLLSGREVTPHRFGNRLVFCELSPGDVITIAFPMVETIESYTEATYDRTYRCHFKGNTLIDISPRATRPAWNMMGDDAGNMLTINKGYPLYRRDFYKRDRAPMKKARRFVSENII